MILALHAGITVEKNAAVSAKKDITGTDCFAAKTFHECDTAVSDKWRFDVV